MFREERGGEDEDIMQTRKENEEKYSVYFWRQKKKDSVMQLPRKWKKTQERKEFQEAGAGPLCHVMQRG